MPLQEIVIGRTPSDLKTYGIEGTIFLGKHLVGSGEDAHLTNPVRMDVARPHVILICGKRGSGKSYTGAVIAEEILKLRKDIRKMNILLESRLIGITTPTKSEIESIKKFERKRKKRKLELIPLNEAEKV